MVEQKILKNILPEIKLIKNIKLNNLHCLLCGFCEKRNLTSICASKILRSSSSKSKSNVQYLSGNLIPPYRDGIANILNNYNCVHSLALAFEILLVHINSNSTNSESHGDIYFHTHTLVTFTFHHSLLPCPLHLSLPNSPTFMLSFLP